MVYANVVTRLFSAAHQGLEAAHIATAGIGQMPGPVFLLSEISFYLLKMLRDFLGAFRRKLLKSEYSLKCYTPPPAPLS